MRALFCFLFLLLAAPASAGTVKCGGVNDTATIQNSLNAGGTTTLPAGTCAYTSLTLQVSGAHLVGQGLNATTLQSNNGSSDDIVFAAGCSDCSVENLTMVNVAASPTAGCAVDSTGGTGDNRVIRVRIQKGYHGICMNNAFLWPYPVGVLSVDKVDIAQMTGNGYLINGASQFFLSNATTYNTGGPGLQFVNSGGAWIENVTFQLGPIGLLVNPGAGQHVLDTYLTNVEADSSFGAYGFSFDTSGGGLIWNVSGTNIRAGYGSGDGFFFNGPGTTNINLTNFMSERNAKNGVDIAGGGSLNLHEGQVLGNGSTGPGYNGFTVTGGTSIDISDSVINYTDPVNANSNQGWALFIGSGFTGSLNFHDNDTSGGNVSGSILNQSTSSKINV